MQNFVYLKVRDDRKEQTKEKERPGDFYSCRGCGRYLDVDDVGLPKITQSGQTNPPCPSCGSELLWNKHTPYELIGAHQSKDSEISPNLEEKIEETLNETKKGPLKVFLGPTLLEMKTRVQISYKLRAAGGLGGYNGMKTPQSTIPLLLDLCGLSYKEKVEKIKCEVYKRWPTAVGVKAKIFD